MTKVRLPNVHATVTVHIDEHDSEATAVVDFMERMLRLKHQYTNVTVNLVPR